MAESTLSVTLNSLRQDIGPFLGYPRSVSSWSNTEKTDFDYVVDRGLRLFYFPPTGAAVPFYEWSFMRKTGTITLLTDDEDYDLPDDFGGTIIDDSLTYASGTANRNPMVIDESAIRSHQAMDQQTGVPKYVAVRNKAHAPATGQRWELLVYPKPTSSENNTTITYRYNYVPDALTEAAPYPVGGARYSEVIHAAVLAAAEAKADDDPAGTHFQRFMLMLNSAIRADQSQKDHEGAQ